MQSKAKNIVTIGGGTGSYNVLSGLKNLPNFSITALVSMADDGGSGGALRNELGVLPPGDVRLCLVALSEHSNIMGELMNYRFKEGTLIGHNFGNIFLAAFEKVTGDFAKGVEIAGEILKIKGRVIPVTKNKAELVVSLVNGKVFEGENNIQNADLQSVDIKEVFYKNKVLLNEHAKVSLLKADFIVLGPGNYFCSVLPNLIVEGFREAILKSKAKIILPINLTNKSGHTTNWKVADYVKDVEKYLRKPVDFILVNNDQLSKEQIERYKQEEGEGVLIEDNLNDNRVIRASLLSNIIFEKAKEDILPSTKGFIRHDSKKLAECIERIIKK
ncbi:MAG: gluconeogenesis factor YvcK family protein [Patescibacteria group bacterium]